MFNEIQDKILTMLQLGATVPVAFSATGTAPAERADWLADREFAEAVEKAQALFEVRMLKRLSDDESGAGARWLLERRFPDRYGAAAVKATAAAASAAAVADSEATAAVPDSALARAEQRRRRAPTLAIVQTAP